MQSGNSATVSEFRRQSTAGVQTRSTPPNRICAERGKPVLFLPFLKERRGNPFVKKDDKSAGKGTMKKANALL